jgi:hypothetical protein
MTALKTVHYTMIAAMAVGQVAHLIFGNSQLAASAIAVLIPTLLFLLLQSSHRFLPRTSAETKNYAKGELSNQ